MLTVEEFLAYSIHLEAEAASRFGELADAIRIAGKLSEQFGQFGIDTLGNVTVSRHKVFRLRIIEAWIGPEKYEKVLKGAFELHLLNNCFHLFVNASHFASTDFVDLLWRKISCCFSPYSIGIKRGAIGKRGRANVLSTGG